MSSKAETKFTPGPWRLGPINYADIYSSVTGGLVALAIKGLPETVANAHVLKAAPDLYAAAQLACLMFKRKNLSTAESDWMGDDEHEAWSALERATARARGEEPEGGTR